MTELETTKKTLWSQFRNLMRRRTPPVAVSNLAPETAFELGWRLGLRTGYEEGVSDGIGIDKDTPTPNPEIH
jgi:hypothetical protein